MNISPNEPLISDGHDSASFSFNPEHGRGYIARDYHRHPYGSYARSLTVPLVPRSEWKARIDAMTESKTRLSDVIRGMNIPPKNQKSTNYCWVFAPTSCVEITRVLCGLPYVSLSPASIGALIKNYQNVGGWGSEAIKQLSKTGPVPSELWPDTAIDRQYDTPASRAEREKYLTLEWEELAPRSLDEVMTCLFYRIPVAVGLDWWRHEVYACDPAYEGDQFGWRFRNSWGQWGENGFGVVVGQKAIPDDAVICRYVIPSPGAQL